MLNGSPTRWCTGLLLLLWCQTTWVQAFAKCGGNLTQSSGMILTPGYPFSYPDNADCYWTITAAEGQIISLSFQRIDIGIYCNGYDDFVEVYDGDDRVKRLGPLLCGSKTEDELASIRLRSSKNKMQVYFHSNNAQAASGFVATYWAYECPPFSYGSDICYKPCDCVKENTISCDNEHGTCLCKDGWTSHDCSEDVNECAGSERELCTEDNMVCHNLLGSYKCDCDSGLQMNSTGQCEGKGECTSKQCSPPGICAVTRTTPRYEKCYCPRGMMLAADGVTCHECSDTTYGPDCLKACNCIWDNTETCDKRTGECYCKKGYTGSDCRSSVNECGFSPGPCGVNSYCSNYDNYFPASYQCTCQKGYENIGGSCKACGRNVTSKFGAITILPDYYYLGNGKCCWWTIYSAENTVSLMIESYQWRFPTSHTILHSAGQVAVYNGITEQGDLLGYLSTTGIIKSKSSAVHIVHSKIRSDLDGITLVYSTQECTLKTCSHFCKVTSMSPRTEQCLCSPGMKLDPADDSSCIACDEWTFGKNCVNECSCNRNQTKACDKATGYCNCHEGFQSSDCESDIYERDNSLCGGDGGNGIVYNIFGSFECRCFRSFEYHNGSCQACGRELTDPSGKISSGLYENGFDDVNEECSWTITVELHRIISLRFTEAEIGAFVEVYDVGGGYKLLSNFSGYSASDDLNSSSNQVLIKRFGSKQKSSKFIAEYWSEVNPKNQCNKGSCPDICAKVGLDERCICPLGTKLTGNQCVECTKGTYGVNCASTCDCIQENTDSCDKRTGMCTCLPGWTSSDCSIDVNECQRGSLFSCKAHSVCRNGYGGYFCECQKDYGYLESQNGSCVKQACGGLLNESVGTFTSIFFPDPYARYVDCQWTIQTDTGKVISLIFETFDIDSCCGTMLEVYDSSNTSSNLLATYKRPMVSPVLIKSPSNTMQVIFKSGYRNNGKGFSARYLVTECPQFTYGLEDCASSCSCVQSNTEYCNSTYGDCVCKKGWTSIDCSVDVNECTMNPCPEYSDCKNTRGSYECVCWTGLEMGSSGSCQVKQGSECNDNPCSHTCVETYAGKVCYCPDGMKLKGEICIECSNFTFGRSCSSICDCADDHSSGCDRVTGECKCQPGWTLANCTQDVDECRTSYPCGSYTTCTNTYGSFTCTCKPGYEESSDGSCELVGCKDIVYTDPSGEIRSPNYPYNYPDYATCTWTIKAEEGKVVTFSFLDLHVQGCSSYRQEYVEIYDGTSNQDKLLLRSCTNLPQNVTSTGNAMHILFTADWRGSRHQRGLRGIYNTSTPCRSQGCQNPIGTLQPLDCNKTLSEPSGSIVSPTPITANSRNEDIIMCKWTISGAQDQVVTIRSEYFDIPSSGSCSYGSVELFDGATSTDRLIGEYCGHIPKLLRSSSSNMLIAFQRRSNYNSYLGFNMTYTLHTCPAFRHGDTCQLNCQCVRENSQSCDSLDGFCICKPGWMGQRCEVDVDECQNPKICPVNEECINNKGGYSCLCQQGYARDKTDGLCKADTSQCEKQIASQCSHLCYKSNNGKDKCACPEDMELDSSNTQCIVSYYPYGKSAGDSSQGEDYNKDKNGYRLVSGPVTYSAGIPFGQNLLNQAYVMHDGAIGFNERMAPLTYNVQDLKTDFLGPYWCQMDPAKGNVYFHLYEKCGASVFDEHLNTSTSPKKEAVMERARRHMLQYKPTASFSEFDVNTVLVVTWKEAQRFQDKENSKQEQKATFQTVVISGNYGEPRGGIYHYEAEETSRAFYLYQEEKMEWSYRKDNDISVVFSEHSAKPKVFDCPYPTPKNKDLKAYREQSFLVGKVNHPVLKCQRYLCSNSELVQNDLFKYDADQLYKCPCTLGRLGPHWQLYERRGDDVHCYVLSPVAKRRLLSGNLRNKLCCYKKSKPASVNWEDELRSLQQASHIHGPSSTDGGHILIRDPWDNWSTESYRQAMRNIQAHQWCCKEAQNDQLCERFYKVFPDPKCSPAVIYVPASALGDPHIETLDKLQYSMNGWGEYIMMDIPTQDFILQARTGRAQTKDKVLTKATVFTAFAARENDYAKFQVELSISNTTMVILANGSDVTKEFYAKEDFKFQTAFSDTISVSRKMSINNEIMVEAVFPCGVSLQVQVGFQGLEIDIEVNIDLMGLTKGLLGNFNNDSSDDFQLPNGTVLPKTMSERDIFNKFAKAYLVTSETSVFLYEGRETTNDYQHPEFIPMFIDEESPQAVAEAERICGELNQACIFDYLATKNKDFAEHTKSSRDQSVAFREGQENNPPTLSVASNENFMNNIWVVDEGTRNSLRVLAEDEDGDRVTYSVVGGSGLITVDGNGNVNYTPNRQNPLTVGLQANDSKGGYSSTEQLNIRICPTCSNHGHCDRNATREGELKEKSFQLLKCICQPAYTGVDCEAELDGCASLPCFKGQDCTDLTAAEQGDNPVGYSCGPCPDGYVEYNETCVDVDECSGANVCEQVCVNSEGSYYCVCHAGYRLDRHDRKTCNDINECEERTALCQHNCENTEGNYTCSCTEGYNLNADGVTCILESRNREICDSCEQVCSVENGAAVCSCNRGYEPEAPNSPKCKDVDECNSGSDPCGQNCTNTDGQFLCSCFPGYELDVDGVSCVACEAPLYGENCSSICNCNGLGTCDTVKGCVCKDKNWTGPNCDQDVDECAQTDVCDEGLVCRNELGSYSCVCPAGYIMEDGTCTDVNECLSLITISSCNLTTEICVNTEGSFKCDCQPGFARNSKMVCEDIDECRKNIDECEQECQNVPGRYNCVCYPGFKLSEDRLHCRKTSDICGDKNPGCSHGCSLDENDVPFCICPRGYEKNGSTGCQDINECATDVTNLCQHKSTCKNTDGGFTCACLPGYKLDNDGRSCITCTGKTWGEACNNSCNCGQGSEYCDPETGCVCKLGFTGNRCTNDVDECAGGEVRCLENEVCINEPGFARCGCQAGFKKHNGVLCTDINECEDNNLNSCDQKCSNSLGSFSCSCYPGFTLNTTTGKCEDVDECKEGTSSCEEICINTEGSFRCSCPSGQQLQKDGRTCEAHTTCTCVETNTDYCDSSTGQCVCKPGWTSSDCSQDADDCIVNVCPHYLDCKDRLNGFDCVCWNGFEPAGVNKTCEDCNRVLTDQEGRIMSSNYPRNYPNNAQCSWTIQASDLAVINLRFHDYAMEGCPYDFIKVFDGSNDNADLIGEYCSLEGIPNTITASGNAMTIVFTSDSSVSDKGFSASYTAKIPCKEDKCSHDCIVTSTNPWKEECSCPQWMRMNQKDPYTCVELNECNTTITDRSGYIVSEGYPNNYKDNTVCYWHIQAPETEVVLFRISEMDMEGSVNCPYDSVDVYDGGSTSAPLIDQICGSSAPTSVTSTGSSMYIVFRSDESVNKRGFKGTYVVQKP